MSAPHQDHCAALRQDILKVVLTYAVFGGLWIVLSDWGVESLFDDMTFLHVAQTLKGWLFVGATSLLLYLLLVRMCSPNKTTVPLPVHAGLVNWPRWQLYLFAAALILVTLPIRQSIAASFDDRPLLLLFVFPIIVSATLGGFGPGVFATLFAALLVNWFALPPTGSLHIEHAYDLFQLGFLIGNGLLVSLICRMLNDARHRAEISLAEKTRAMQLLDGIAQSSTDAIFAKDTDDRFILFNPAAERITGKTAAEVLGRDEHAIFPPEIAAKVIADNHRVMQTGKTQTFHDDIITVDGPRTFLATKGPLHDANGKVIGMFGISRDITPLARIQKALTDSEARFHALFDNATVGIMVHDLETGTVLEANPKALEFYGDIIGKDLRAEGNWLPAPYDYEHAYAHLRDAATSGPQHFEWHNRAPGGNTLWGDVLFSRIMLNDAEHLLSVTVDITERKQTEDRIRKLSQAVEQSPASILITNTAGGIEYVNEAFVRTSGYSREEVAGQNPSILQSGKTPHSEYEAMWKNLAEGQVWEGEFVNKRKDGSEYTEHAVISPIVQPDGQVTHYVAVQEDITQKKLAAAEINRLAFYDTLTGLPNRTLLLERMAQTLALAHRDHHHSALLLLDIDRFKTINDAGGHALGDALLKALPERLSALLREGDVLARLSGDEFAILLPDFAARQRSAAHQALHVADKLIAALQRPFDLEGEVVTISAGLGVAMFPEGDADTPLDILRRATTAQHAAKARGTGQIAFFEGELDTLARQRFDIERDLRRGVAAGELRLYLQPQVDAAGTPVGAEALVRWQHPQRGLVPPAVFIPLAEESELIVEVDQWVFAEVCRLLAQHELRHPLRIAVNISPRHFRRSDFSAWLKRTLAATGADPARLTLEITEGVVIDNFNDVVTKMNELSALGIHFSMDDFGTGYSSLAYLKRLPINELKIDKTFVQDVTTDLEDAALVETILAVAKLMHLKVVAEGVETAEQAAFLNARATVIHQGYLFGRPEPAETVLARLKE